MLRRWFAVLAVVLPVAAGAAEMLRLEVGQAEETYRIGVEARLSASPERVWEALTDYPRLPELSPTILESRVLDAPDTGVQRVFTLLHSCILIFCGEKRHVQDVTVPGEWELRADTVPEQSDFAYGLARWWIFPDKEGTRVRFDTEIRPSFWVPPMIGPWAIKRSLRADAEATMAGLERSANSR